MPIASHSDEMHRSLMAGCPLPNLAWALPKVDSGPLPFLKLPGLTKSTLSHTFYLQIPQSSHSQALPAPGVLQETLTHPPQVPRESSQTAPEGRLLSFLSEF